MHRGRGRSRGGGGSYVNQNQPQRQAEEVYIPHALHTAEVQQTLREFIEMRYDPQRQMCNLSELSRVPQLMQRVERLTTGTFNAIFEHLSRLHPDCHTLLLDGNQFRTLYMLSGLSNFMPQLLNLSVAGNQLQQAGGLQPLRQLNQLRELVLTGNPLTQQQNYRQEISKMLPSLQLLDGVAVDRSSPSGAPSVNQQQSSAIASQAEVADLKLPLEVRGKFFDTEQTQLMVQQFLTKFMHCHDTDRTLLLDAYADNGQFTVSLSDTVTYRQNLLIKGEVDPQLKQVGSTQSGRGSTHSQSAESLAASAQLLKNNRNLVTAQPGHTDQFARMVQCGAVNILHLLANLPQTTHEHFDKFIIDAWQMPAATSTSPARLVIRLSGRVELQDSDDSTSGGNRNGSMLQASSAKNNQSNVNVNGKNSLDYATQRQFTRSLVLVPSLPGTRAYQNQSWPVQIVNDMLTLQPTMTDQMADRIRERLKRASSGGPRGSRGGRFQKSSQNQQPPAVISDLSVLRHGAQLTPVVGVQPTNGQQQQQPQLTPQQLELAQRFSLHTRLNMEFSCMCLAEQQWDGNKALAAFQQAQQQGIIPKNAFLDG